MPKAVTIIKKDSNGAPDIGAGWQRWVYVGDLPGAYAVYIIVGSGAQLTAIQGMANCVGGILVTGDGVRWAELDVPVPAALRTKINTYRAANSLGPIGAGVTLLQVIKFAAAAFDWGTHDAWSGT